MAWWFSMMRQQNGFSTIALKSSTAMQWFLTTGSNDDETAPLNNSTAQKHFARLFASFCMGGDNSVVKCQSLNWKATEWISVAVVRQELSPQPPCQDANFRLAPAANCRHQHQITYPHCRFSCFCWCDSLQQRRMQINIPTNFSVDLW